MCGPGEGWPRIIVAGDVSATPCTTTDALAALEHTLAPYAGRVNAWLDAETPAPACAPASASVSELELMDGLGDNDNDDENNDSFPGGGFLDDEGGFLDD